MKLTNKQLRQIIKEELEAVLGESSIDKEALLSKASFTTVKAAPSDTEGDYAYNNGVTAVVHNGQKYYIKGEATSFARKMGFKYGSVYINPDEVSIHL